jgi:hypothetical protein
MDDTTGLEKACNVVIAVGAVALIVGLVACFVFGWRG